MNRYKVIDISEQNFGCEERPDSREYCVDVKLQNTDDNSIITISIPDAELYNKNIDINYSVIYDGKLLTNAD